jgi:membrane protein DedA with SNARE-associated domain/membrane-associated phospholipid phosphatase
MSQGGFGGHRRTIVLTAVVVIAFMLLRDKLPSIDIESLLESISGSLGAWTYLLVGGLAFLETGAFVGLIAPGEFTVILGGAVAGQGDISLPLIIAVTWLCAFLGDSVSFLIGHRLGREFLLRHGPRVGINEARLKQVEAYFDRHGGKTILIGRFIGLVRALAPFIAGSSKMRYAAFAPYSILGTGIWATGLILVGYFSSQSIDQAASAVGHGLIAFGVLVGVIVGITLLVRYLRVPENREKVIPERLRPEAEFLWRRLTPGRLGLELTSLLAVIAVGGFVLIAYTAIVSGDGGPTPGDQTWIDFVEDHLRAGWLTDVVKVLTTLGTFYVVIPIAIVGAVVLARRGELPQMWVLIAGMLTIVVGTNELKDIVDRSRPPGGLVSVGNASFPSAHASYSTLYTYLAVLVAARTARPGLSVRGAAIAAGLAITVLVGLSRVYLGVHYMSDVSAGWALGATAFAAAGAVALVATHIRQNEPADGSA